MSSLSPILNSSTSILDFSSPEMTLANHTILISHKRCKNFDQTTFATLAANFCTASSPVELHHERQIRTPRALAGAAAAIRAPAHFYKCSVLDILITWSWRRDGEPSLMRKSIEFWGDGDDAGCVHGNKWGRRRTLARPLPLHYQVIITRPWQPPSAPDPRQECAECSWQWCLWGQWLWRCWGLFIQVLGLFLNYHGPHQNFLWNGILACAECLNAWSTRERKTEQVNTWRDENCRLGCIDIE